ncbi:hypothetical protein CP532_3255 [Ophiocordyceps camponoti-leonardi (nom. inval.)]|nr:hypothetical protein CP532_3255 [Ophiocordyceps camponoti-leonardi (nom. inval.)]
MRILTAIIAIVTTASAAPTVHDNGQVQRRSEFAEPFIGWKRFVGFTYPGTWGRRKGRHSTPLVTTRRRKDPLQEEEEQLQRDMLRVKVQGKERLRSTGRAKDKRAIDVTRLETGMPVDEPTANEEEAVTGLPSGVDDGLQPSKDEQDEVIEDVGIAKEDETNDLPEKDLDGLLAAADDFGKKVEGYTSGKQAHSQASKAKYEAFTNNDRETGDEAQDGTKTNNFTDIVNKPQNKTNSTTQTKPQDSTQENQQPSNNKAKDAAATIQKSLEEMLSKTYAATQEWFQDAAKETQDWLRSAAKETHDWFRNAAKTSDEWFDVAVKDSGDWFSTAARDTADWFGSAFKDVGTWFSSLS